MQSVLVALQHVILIQMVLDKVCHLLDRTGDGCYSGFGFQTKITTDKDQVTIKVQRAILFVTDTGETGAQLITIQKFHLNCGMW